MIEVMFFIGLVVVSVLFGYWQNNNLWINKADDITRKECRGKLYWVIEDGDIDKFHHVQHWIEND